MANYCTLNPLSSRYMTLSEGNLKVVSRASGDARIIGTIGVTSGKWYWEYTWSVGQHPGPTGVVSQKYWNEYSHPNGVDGIGGANAVGSYQYEGYSTTISGGGNTYTSAPSAVSSGQTVMIAFDVDNLKLWFGKDGTWFNSGDPANGSNPSVTMSGAGEQDQTWFPHFTDNYGSDTSGGTFNFGSSEFKCTPPTGFLAINTENLAEPAFSPLAAQSPSDHFNTVLYTGNGGTQSITGVGFQPGFTWIKERTGAEWHCLVDEVRGSTNRLFSNEAYSEANTANAVTSFDSDGFSLGSHAGQNSSGESYVAWNWKGTGSSVTNTDGTITSTVSANTDAGFSIVTFTGSGTNQTVGHGLGAAPDVIISRSRNNAAPNWVTYHKHLGRGSYMHLNLTNGVGTATDYWGTSDPGASTFGFASSSYDNANGNMVAYCWTAIDGYSKFGNYVGNGDTNGPFIHTGFRPAFVLVKRTDTTGQWFIFDSVRSQYNPVDKELYPQATTLEGTGTPKIDFVSNGFKMRTTGNDNNASQGTYLYMAFAEDPFKYNTAR